MQKYTEVKVETSKERSETNLLCALTYDPNVLWVLKTDVRFSPLWALCGLVNPHVFGNHKTTEVCVY